MKFLERFINKFQIFIYVFSYIYFHKEIVSRSINFVWGRKKVGLNFVVPPSWGNKMVFYLFECLDNLLSKLERIVLGLWSGLSFTNSSNTLFISLSFTSTSESGPPIICLLASNASSEIQLPIFELSISNLSKKSISSAKDCLSSGLPLIACLATGPIPGTASEDSQPRRTLWVNV